MEEVSSITKLIIYTDGASRGNPGEAGIGVVIYNDQEEVVQEISEYLGQATNNVAEYTALIRGLEEGLKIGGDQVEVYADSELLVKQLKGEYRVKNPGLIPLFQKITNLRGNFESFNITHVRREYNKRADMLANQAIDQNFR